MERGFLPPGVRRGAAGLVLVTAVALTAAGGGAALTGALNEASRPMPFHDPTWPTIAPVAPKAARGLRPSRPVRLEIPRLGVRTSLLSLGKNPDGTLQVPSIDQVDQAGWYRYGAAPGSRGAAVIAGHIDSRTGPAVFHRLSELRPGDRVAVLRKDKRTAVFQIDRVARVPKSRFPTTEVYGDLAYPGIRLITCGGSFDRTAHQYTENVIAYGHLVKVRTVKKSRKARSKRSAPVAAQGRR